MDSIHQHVEPIGAGFQDSHHSGRERNVELKAPRPSPEGLRTMTRRAHIHQRPAILINEDKLNLHRPSGLRNLALYFETHCQCGRGAWVSARRYVVEQAHECLPVANKLIGEPAELAI